MKLSCITLSWYATFSCIPGHWHITPEQMLVDSPEQSRSLRGGEVWIKAAERCPWATRLDVTTCVRCHNDPPGRPAYATPRLDASTLQAW